MATPAKSAGVVDRCREEVPLGLLRDAKRAVDSAHEHLTIGAPDDDLVVGEDGRAGTTQRKRDGRLPGALVAEEHVGVTVEDDRRSVEPEPAEELQQLLEVHHDVVVDVGIRLIGHVHDEPRARRRGRAIERELADRRRHPHGSGLGLDAKDVAGLSGRRSGLGPVHRDELEVGSGRIVGDRPQPKRVGEDVDVPAVTSMEP